MLVIHIGCADGLTVSIELSLGDTLCVFDRGKEVFIEQRIFLAHDVEALMSKGPLRCGRSLAVDEKAAVHRVIAAMQGFRPFDERHGNTEVCGKVLHLALFFGERFFRDSGAFLEHGGDIFMVRRGIEGDAVLVLFCLEYLEEMIIGFGDGGHLCFRGIRVGFLSVSAGSCLFPTLLRAVEGEVIVRYPLFGEFVANISLEGACSKFDRRSPVAFALADIEHAAADFYLRFLMDGPIDICKCLDDFLAREIRAWDLCDVLFRHTLRDFTDILFLCHVARGDGTFGAVAGEEIVNRVEPLVGKRAGTILLVEVDRDLTGVVMSHCLGHAVAAELHGKCMAEAQGLRWESCDVGKVHHSLVEVVEVFLAALVLDPVAELGTRKAEFLLEVFWRDIVGAVRFCAAPWLCTVDELIRDDEASLISFVDSFFMRRKEVAGFFSGLEVAIWEQRNPGAPFLIAEGIGLLGKAVFLPRRDIDFWHLPLWLIRGFFFGSLGSCLAGFLFGKGFLESSGGIFCCLSVSLLDDARPDIQDAVTPHGRDMAYDELIRVIGALMDGIIFPRVDALEIVILEGILMIGSFIEQVKLRGALATGLCNLVAKEVSTFEEFLERRFSECDMLVEDETGNPDIRHHGFCPCDHSDARFLRERFAQGTDGSDTPTVGKIEELRIVWLREGFREGKVGDIRRAGKGDSTLIALVEILLADEWTPEIVNRAILFLALDRELQGISFSLGWSWCLVCRMVFSGGGFWLWRGRFFLCLSFRIGLLGRSLDGWDIR